MAKLLIFDFDGTLMDTCPGIHLAVNDTLKEIGEPEVSYETVKQSVGFGLLHLIKSIKPKIDLSPENLKRMADIFRGHYDNYYLTHSSPFDGVLDFLDSWPHDLAIGSNKHDDYIKSLLSRPPWNSIKWCAIYGGNTLKTKKPEPEMIDKIIESSRFSREETLIIGDGHPDIEVAKNANIKSVAVSYGYSNIQELIALGANESIDHISELPEKLKKLF